jgi:molecular chaperone Hsp33
MLRLLGHVEVESILAELGKIDVNCDFCNKQYRFDAIDAAQALLEPARVLAPSLAKKNSAPKH